MVKCWRCGAENDPRNQWCESCATWMTDTRDGEEIKLTAPGNLGRLSRSIGRMALRSSILAIAVIGIMTAIVGVYDILTDHRVLVGISEILGYTGLVLIFASFISGRKDPKSMVLTGYSPGHARRPLGLFTRTIIKPMLRTMRKGESGIGENMLAIQMIAGLMVFAVALYTGFLTQ